MSKLNISHTKIPPEARKFPFDQTFLCPKCSEILFVKIHYIDATMIPQVKYKCPKRHSGTVDLLLFFNLFHSSNKEIEDELSKFDDKLEKDIELFKSKKMKDRKILDPINFAKIINKKNKEKEEEKNKEKIEENKNENKDEIKQIKEDNDNQKLFAEIKKCNEIKFSLLNIKKEIKEQKISEKQHPKSESKAAEKPEEKSPEIKPNIKKIIKNNKNSFSPKSKINNINTIKKENSNSEKEKEDSKEEKEEKEKTKEEEIKIKETKETKDQKETKEDKFTCSYHGNRFTGYCFSCKKDMCKKCFKTRGHKKRKIFANVLLSEKNLNELNKILSHCQESLNKFENKAHSLMEELSNKERNEKIILNIMSKAFIDINRENLKEIREVIKTYGNCVKKNMLNFEIIMDVKNLNIKNVIVVPKDISELIKILKNYKNYIIQRNTNKKVNNETEDKSKENKYLQLFNAFFELLKNYENKEINFKEIVEDENFRKIINSNDYGNIDINKEENNNKIMTEEEKELNDIENMEEYDMNYVDDCYDNYDDCFEDEEENENDIEYEDDYEEEYNDEDLEEECIYAINENKKNELNEQNENEEQK